MTAFPQTVLDAQVDIQLASTWTPIKSYVLQRDGAGAPITIGRGRADESASTNPATLTCDINNRDGRFSVRNPTGPYFGQIGRNTPIRVSVPSQNTHLRLADDSVSGISTPTSASLNVAGDLELQIDTRLDGYSQPGRTNSLAIKWGASGQFSWYLEVLANGAVRFWRATTGSDLASVDSTLPLPLGRVALKVTYATATGAVTYYTAPSISGSWTQLGSAVAFASGGAIFASTAPVQIGNPAAALTGRFYALKVLSGIGGTVVASPDFTSATPGNATLTDAQGNVWTLHGTAEFSARSYRFHGEMSSLPTTWDTSGNDVWVPLAGGGLLRRLSQGNAPIDSALKRALLSQTGTLAVHQYWPCEDLQASVSIGSATGGPLMTINGGTGDGSVTKTGPAFAADSTFLCSAALPTVNDSTWVGQVPAYTSNGSIIVRFLMKISTEPPTGARIMRVITTGTCMEVSVYYSAGGGLGIAGFAASGGIFDSGVVAFGAVGEQLWVSIELQPGGGGTTNYSLVTLQPGATSGLATSGSFTGTIGNATAVYVDPFADMTGVTIGHISVQSAWESLFNLGQPFNAWQGEVAGHRFLRLCQENNIAARCYGPPDTTVPMGAQSPQTLPQLLQECEDADRGQLFEPRQALALGYRTQVSMLNQAAVATIDYSLAELGGAELKPTTDDQYTKNDMTLQRGSGSVSGATYRFVLADGSAMSVSPPPVGVGDYTDSKTVNVFADTQLPDEASWMVHVATVNEARWPILPVNMARAAVSGIFYTVQEADIGDYLAVINPPGQLPPDPVKQLALGTKETLGGYHYQIEFNAVPESPYETGIFDDPVYGRADTDGSVLAAAITSTATTLQAVTLDVTKPLWTTAAADFPFDIAVSGERMTATAIAAAAAGSLGIADGTFESGVSGWSPSGGTLAQSSAHAHGGTFSALLTVSGSPSQAFFRPNAQVPVNPGVTYTASVWLYSTSTPNAQAAIDWYDVNGNYLSTSSGAIAAAGASFTQYTVAAAAPAAAAHAVYGPTLPGSPANGTALFADDVLFTALTQVFTVTRSVNTVVKSQAAGTDVRLWFPPIFAML